MMPTKISNIGNNSSITGALNAMVDSCVLAESSAVGNEF